MVWRQLGVAAALCLCTCGGRPVDEACVELGEQLRQMIRGSGNTDGQSPTIEYDKVHYDLLEQRAQRSCATLDLGKRPFLCNLGLPQCPDGYACITSSTYILGACERQSAP